MSNCKGLRKSAAAFPLGCLLPDPDSGASCPPRQGHRHFARQPAISRRLSLPPRACSSSGFALPASRGSHFCQAAQRPCQILHLPEQPRSAEQTLSRRGSCAARFRRRAAGDAAAERAGETGTPGGSGAGSPPDGDLPLPPPARGTAASRRAADGVWKPLAAPRLLLSAPGESLVIPRHASAKDESVFYTLVFGLPSNVKS